VSLRNRRSEFVGKGESKMLFQNIAFFDENYKMIPNGYVAVENKRIVYVGEIPPQGDFGELYQGKGKLLLPGFVNSHSHTPMTLLRGYGENMTLTQWLNHCVFPFEAHWKPTEIYYATLLGIAEMARFGIVSTTDMYYFVPQIAEAFLSAGMKANLSHTIVGTYGGDFNRSPVSLETRRVYSDYHGADDGLVLIDVGLHAEYTTDEKMVRGAVNLAKELKTGIHVHLSETKEEVEGCRNRHKGFTPVQYFNRLGLFEVPVTAAHGVWLQTEDYPILQEHQVTVATCPKSNLKLACGVLPYLALKQAGINVALGTDSVASNNNLNMLEEMRFFALLQKEKYDDPTLVTPAEALQTATINGSKAQRRVDCGRLAEGYRADLIVLDITSPSWQPVHHLMSNLLYSASGSDICLTMVDGQVIYRDGSYPTIDLERVYFEVEAAKKRILGELKAESAV